MLEIDDRNNIVLTRGDTMTLTVGLKKDGQPYAPVEGDTLRFACSEGYEGDPEYRLIYEAAVPTNTLTFTMPATETKKLSYKTYNYDVQITHGDGTVDTFISATMKITGETK